MIINKKFPTIREIIDLLRQGEVSLPPLSIRFLEEEPEKGGEPRLDAVIEISWREHSAKFAVECKSPATPRIFRDGLNRLKFSKLSGYQPLLIMPYLREEHQKTLEKEGISGLDLCGNGVVIVPGSFAVYRSGGENRFTYSAPIKNIYQKNSSMVSRVFLARSRFNAVQDILIEINQRNLLVNRWRKDPMALSTVSKALKTLVEDLIVERNDAISLLQPDKLLQKLSENYTPPKIKERVHLKLPEENGSVQDWLQKIAPELDIPFMATGTSSVTQYTIMQRGDMLSVYCPRLEPLLKHLPYSQTDRFPNLELVETQDETVYFDARQNGGIWWASQVQVYLELMIGDKRDQETAAQIKSLLLKNLEVHP
ncbi:MAG: hypothetical protein JXA42_08800 [Anaerolineales bacterium]|nr:hypothetical protein [Anaerolineales bacterium]